MKCLLGLLCLLASITFFACEQTPKLNVPATYEFSRSGSSTVDFSGQTIRIKMADELSSMLANPDANAKTLLEIFANQSADGNDVDPFSLEVLNESTKSIRSKVAASADFFLANSTSSAAIKEDFETWINRQVTDVYALKNELADIGQAGQIANGSSVRYVNKQGLEYNQAVVKSMIGALMVDQILNHYLSVSRLDDGTNGSDNDEGVTVDGKPYTAMEHYWDEAYGYLFGGCDNALDPIGQSACDDFLHKYLLRVDNDEDFTGVAKDIFETFKLGRAAISAGNYEERDIAVAKLRTLISELIGIRAVYYLQQGKIAKENGQLGTAFHDLSEGYGFIYSLQFTRQSSSVEPYISREDVETILTELTANDGFWSVESATLDKWSEFIASKFSFTLSQAAN